MTATKKMTSAEAEGLLRHVHLELARDPEHPAGSTDHRYEFIAPLDNEGHLIPEAWHLMRDRCRVRRSVRHERDEVGHLVHKPGGAWAFHYDIHGDADHDETGYRLDKHHLVPGEYVSIREQDGVLRTFLVKAVVDLA